MVIEGTSERVLTPDSAWREYEFRGKPGDPHRRPPQIAPYHLRLDWMMWFAALSSRYAEGWFARMVEKLLAGDQAVLRLLRTNPFPDGAPVWIRARYYHYRFTARAGRRASGTWWVRELVGEYLRPVSLAAGDGKAPG